MARPGRRRCGSRAVCEDRGFAGTRSMSHLFSPFTLGSLTLANRIVVAPMCQYSADDGLASAWHPIHLGQLAISGAGLLIIEATAVEAIGRITPGCLGLYSDGCERALAGVLASVRRIRRCRSRSSSRTRGARAPAKCPGAAAR